MLLYGNTSIIIGAGHKDLSLVVTRDKGISTGVGRCIARVTNLQLARRKAGAI
jgi:hypothetical protein